MASSRSLGTLTLDLIAKIGGFEQGMDKAARVSEKRLKEIQATAKKVGTAIGVGLSAGVVGLTALIKHSIDAADDMSKLARSTGLTTEALSQLSYAADLSGVENLGDALNKFNKNIGEAAKGTLAQVDAFEAIGVSIKDVNGNLKPTEQLLNETADAFEKYADGAAKSNVAQQLFGRAGADLITFLDGGSKGLNELRQEADQYGLTINGTAAPAAEQFNDNLSRLKAITEGAGNQIAQGLIPTLSDLSDQYIAAAADGDNLAKATEFIGTAVKGTIASVIALESVFTALGKTIGGVLAASEIFTKDVSISSFIGGKIFYDLGKNAKAAAAVLADSYTDARSSVSDDIEAIANVINAGQKKIANATGGTSASGKPEINLPIASGASGSSKAAKDQKDAVQELIKSLQDQAAALGLNERAQALYKAAAEGATLEQLNQIDTLYDSIEAFDAASKSAADLKSMYDQYKNDFEGITSSQAAFNQEFDAANALLAAGKINWEQYNNAVSMAQDALDSAGKSAEKNVSQIEELTNELARDIQDDLSNFLFDPFKDGLKGMIQQFGETIRKILADAAAAQITKALFGSDSNGGSSSSNGWIGIALNAFSSYLGGARAMGGPVASGVPYLVGERGPELFKPSVPGSIIPTGKFNAGASTTNHINVNVSATSGMDARRTGTNIGAEIARQLAIASRRNN